ncbi:MAG: PTS sugar transporter subunit IIA [Polyangia bacterium]|jgi:PTS system nitrogen regulatory IIA component
MKVVDFLAPDSIIPSLSGSNKGEVLAELAAFMAGHHSGIDAQVLRHVLEEREQLATTAIGDGIAIPHGKLDTVDRLVGILGRSPAGLDCQSIDGKPTHLLFMLVAPTNSAGVHLKALARLSKLFRDAGFRQKLLDADDGATMYRTIAEEDAKY